jgi:hypothetical protein
MLLAAADDTGEKLAIGSGSAGLTALLMKLWDWHVQSRARPEATAPRASGERLAITETRVEALTERIGRHEAAVAERFARVEQLVRDGFEQVGERLDGLAEELRRHGRR